ncbi:MAG TPA: YggS family pyridoxal phosphate-dependent enzyme [Burkholderiales bacterium]|nr:YggS family pyridoxal phosphate-dependent enzyme [Burkholderiales bacterium]
MAAIADNLQAIRARIGTVTLLAVSKGQGTEKIAAAMAAGQRAFGENYVQEALAKMDCIAGAEWHLIGPLQSNKTRVVAERFDWVQTVASEKIAKRLSEQRPAHLPPLNVLIQVNASGEASKSGVAPEELSQLAASIQHLPNLRLRGLMAIPEPGAPRERYRQVKRLYDDLKTEFGFDTLSLGMSDDLDMAIAEGSTMVRVGTAIFGARQRKAA